MEIEIGEHFIVTRGVPLIDRKITSGPIGEGQVVGQTRTMAVYAYDREHEEKIYKALAFEGGVIVAEIVLSDHNSSERFKVGVKRMINTREVEVWPVTEQFVKAALGERVDT